MNNWSVVNRITGEVVHAYGADMPEHLGEYPLEIYNHIKQIEIAETPKRRLTKLQFRNLFTPDEKVAIEFASLDNPSGTREERLQAAGLRVFLADVEAATPEQDGTSIDLDDPRTVAGVNALETYGLIAADRAAEILCG